MYKKNIGFLEKIKSAIRLKISNKELQEKVRIVEIIEDNLRFLHNNPIDRLSNSDFLTEIQYFHWCICIKGINDLDSLNDHIAAADELIEKYKSWYPDEAITSFKLYKIPLTNF